MRICSRLLLFFLFAGTLVGQNPKHSHQFGTLNNPQYQFIDTSMHSMKWYRQLTISGEDNYGSVDLSNLGGPRNQLLINQPRPLEQFLGLGAYQDYILRPDQVRFYQVKSPLTEARYLNGYDRGQLFSIYHTQNITERWNALIKYQRLNSLSFFANDQNKQVNFLASSQFLSKNGRYQLKTFFSDQKLEMQEFGGIVADSIVLDNLEPNRTLITPNLDRDQSFAYSRQFYLDHSLILFGGGNKKAKEPALGLNDSTSLTKDTLLVADSLSLDTAMVEEEVKADESKAFLALGHQLHYRRSAWAYQGFSEDFYDQYFRVRGNLYRDSTGSRSLKNSIYIKTHFGDSLSAFDLQTGAALLNYDYTSGNAGFVGSSLGVFGRLAGNWRDYFDLKAQLDYYFSGALANSLDFQLRLQTIFYRNLGVYFQYRLNLQYPEFFDQFYLSNNFIWNQNFDQTGDNSIAAGLRWGEDNFLQLATRTISNFVYYDAQSIPQQSAEALVYTQVDLKQDFDFLRRLHFDNRATWQQPLQNGALLPLPELVIRNSLYVDFEVFSGVLKCLVGLEHNYFSRFAAQNYNPALGRFYLANERPVGDYPLIDLFAQVKLGKARFFFKLEHANQGLNGFDYFAAPRFPINDRIFRIGINWRFFN
jgi:hypothetical protein